MNENGITFFKDEWILLFVCLFTRRFIYLFADQAIILVIYFHEGKIWLDPRRFFPGVKTKITKNNIFLAQNLHL